MEEEIWKPIKGYETLYEVSNCGRVKRLNYTAFCNGGNQYSKFSCKKKLKEKFLCFGDNGHGYQFIILYKNKISKNFYVHRLVAEAFIPNPNNLPEVNHKDGNKQNNCVSNLEWCTNGENQKHAYKTGLHKTIKIAQYDLNGNFIKNWNSIAEAQKQFNPDTHNIHKCIRDGRHKSYGFLWYKSEEFDN